MKSLQKPSSTGLFGLSWSTYIGILGLLLSIGFLSSGVITWIAANWEHWTSFQKIYGVQILFALSVVLALVSHARRTEVSGAGLWTSRGFFFLAAVIVGGVFALIGQTYQTGADTWQLFAVWSVFQLLLFLALPQWASAALLMVSLATTAILFGLEQAYSQIGDLWFTQYLQFVGLALLVITECCKGFFRDTSWRILVRFSALFLVVVNFTYGVIVFDEFSLLINLVVAGVLFAIYTRWIKDIVIATLACLLALAVLMNRVIIQPLMESGLEAGLFVVAGVVLFVALVLIVKLIQRVFNANHMSQEGKDVSSPKLGMHWVLQIVMTIVMLLVGGFLIIGLLIALGDSFIEGLGLYVLGLVLYVLTWFIYRGLKNKEGNSIAFIASQSLMLLAVGFLFAGVWLNDMFEFAFSSGNVLLWVNVVLLAVIVWRFESQLVPIIAVMMIWVALDIIMILMLGFDDSEIEFFTSWFTVITSLVMMVIAYVLTYHTLSEKLSSICRAVFLGSFLFSAVYMAWSLIGGITFYSAWSDWMDPEDFPLFSAMTGGLYTAFSLGNLHLYLFAIAPAACFYAFVRDVDTKLRLLSTAVILVLGLLWINAPGMLLAMIVLIIAYAMGNISLFVLGLLSAIGILTYLYYSLNSLLIQKAYFLLILGTGVLVALIIGITITGVYRRTKTSKMRLGLWGAGYLGKSVAIFGVIGMLSALVLANWSVQRYEGVLNHGRTVILALAPVDPRSLMQGDYMELEFTALDEAEQRMVSLDVINRQSQVRLLLREDERGIAHFCGFTDMGDTQEACFNGFEITVKNRGNRDLRMSTHQYFFAEGKGSYFDKARFGEFKLGDSGLMLLKQLLDENLNPL